VQYLLKYKGAGNIVLPPADCVTLYPEEEVTTLGKFNRGLVEKRWTDFKKFYVDYYKERPELYSSKRNYN